ncbi:MAG: pyridoxamine 5'-phosphate oxidase family protein [Gemmatimonadota bacterium]
MTGGMRASRLLPAALAFASLWLMAAPVNAQATAPRPVQRATLGAAASDTALRVARDIMRAARYAALITHDVGAGATARTIDPAPPDSAMVVRFATNPKSRKVRQIARDSRVALYYFDAKGLRYVTLYGRAREVRDGESKRRFWYAEWTPFYPGRERGATLYEVIPERAEVVSPGDGVMGDTLTWAPPTIRFPRRSSR